LTRYHASALTARLFHVLKDSNLTRTHANANVCKKGAFLDFILTKSTAHANACLNNVDRDSTSIQECVTASATCRRKDVRRINYGSRQNAAATVIRTQLSVKKTSTWILKLAPASVHPNPVERIKSGTVQTASAYAALKSVQTTYFGTVSPASANASPNCARVANIGILMPANANAWRRPVRTKVEINLSMIKTSVSATVMSL